MIESGIDLKITNLLHKQSLVLGILTFIITLTTAVAGAYQELRNTFFILTGILGIIYFAYWFIIVE